MKKYAIIPINWKKDSKGNFHIRSVLISYKFKYRRKDLINFFGTKIIWMDDYFSDKKASHKYTFTNKWYKLDLVKNNDASKDYADYIYKKRRYHYNKYFIYADEVEFKARSEEEAIKHFLERKN